MVYCGVRSVDRGELVEAVAKALWEAQPEGALPRISWEEAKHPQVKSAGPVYGLADAAIRVVLAEAQRSVEALPARSFAPSLDASQLWVGRGDVLAALAALGDEACSWCDLVGAHASRCPNA